MPPPDLHADTEETAGGETMNIVVKESELTRTLGIAGCKGYVEHQHEDGTVSVCVYDPLDGGLCGPFRISKDDVEPQEAGRVS